MDTQKLLGNIHDIIIKPDMMLYQYELDNALKRNGNMKAYAEHFNGYYSFDGTYAKCLFSKKEYPLLSDTNFWLDLKNEFEKAGYFNVVLEHASETSYKIICEVKRDFGRLDG